MLPRAVWLPLLVCLGCGDGSSFGISGCDDPGDTPFASTGTNTVSRGVHAAVTAAGTAFLIERRELLASLLFEVDDDGWVRLALPAFDFGDDGGGLGVGLRDATAAFDLRSADIDLEFLPEPTRIRLTVRRARVRLDNGVVWISVGGTAACRLGNGIDPDTPREALAEVDIAVDVVPTVDAEGRLQVAVDLLPFTVHALDFTLVYDAALPECADGNTSAECRLVCGLGDAGLELFEVVFEAIDNRLNEVFAPLVEAVVQYFVDDFTEQPLFVEGVLHPRVLQMLLPTAVDAHPLGFKAGPSPEGFTLRSAGDDGDGIGLTLDVGLDTVDHPCVPPVGEPPRFEPGAPPALTGYDHTGQPYHVGLSVSGAVVNRAVWAAYRAGVLCLALDSEQIEALIGQRIDTDTLSIVLPGLRELTGGARPVRVALDTRFEPGDFPLATFFEVADDGGIPQAGVALDFPNVGLSFYGLVEERWSRLFQARVHAALGVIVQATPDNRLALTLATPQIGELRVEYNELLEGANVAELLELVVDVLDSALLSEGLQFDLGLDGLLPRLLGIPLDVRIAALRTDGARADFLSVLLSLTSVPAGGGARATVDTRAALLEAAGDRAVLAVDAGRAARFQWKVDDGVWRPLVAAPGGELVVRDPLLRPLGVHRLSVRAVAEGDYRTLDPTPVVVEIRPTTRGEVGRPRGCASAGGAGAAWWFPVFVAVRRRR